MFNFPAMMKGYVTSTPILPWPFLLFDSSTSYTLSLVDPSIPWTGTIHMLTFNQAGTYTLSWYFIVDWYSGGGSNCPITFRTNRQSILYLSYPSGPGNYSFDVTVVAWEELYVDVASAYHPYVYMGSRINNFKVYTDVDHPGALTTYYP